MSHPVETCRSPRPRENGLPRIHYLHLFALYMWTRRYEITEALLVRAPRFGLGAAATGTWQPCSWPATPSGRAPCRSPKENVFGFTCVRSSLFYATRRYEITEALLVRAPQTTGTWLLLTSNPVRTRDLPFSEEDVPPGCNPEDATAVFLCFYYEVRCGPPI